mmetsp:Transcript_30212/g.54042  ORF Transcript_30212/g.54042 Transcript_30212/m.54042 type:complete len:351 (+) Transcript_30212:188-1240(+)
MAPRILHHRAVALLAPTAAARGRGGGRRGGGIGWRRCRGRGLWRDVNLGRDWHPYASIPAPSASAAGDALIHAAVAPRAALRSLVTLAPVAVPLGVGIHLRVVRRPSSRSSQRQVLCARLPIAAAVGGINPKIVGLSNSDHQRSIGREGEPLHHVVPHPDHLTLGQLTLPRHVHHRLLRLRQNIQPVVPWFVEHAGQVAHNVAVPILTTVHDLRRSSLHRNSPDAHRVHLLHRVKHVVGGVVGDALQAKVGLAPNLLHHQLSLQNSASTPRRERHYGYRGLAASLLRHREIVVVHPGDAFRVSQAAVGVHPQVVATQGVLAHGAWAASYDVKTVSDGAVGDAARFIRDPS